MNPEIVVMTEMNVDSCENYDSYVQMVFFICDSKDSYYSMRLMRVKFFDICDLVSNETVMIACSYKLHRG